MELSGDQRVYLQTVFDHFRQHGEWPAHKYLEHMLWIHPQNWHPDSEKMWRSIYASAHKDLPEEILKEIMAP